MKLKRPLQNTVPLIGAAFSLLLAGGHLYGIDYGTVGSTYTEDFDSGLPTGASTPIWTDDSVFDGWYAYETANNAAPTNYRITSTGNSSEANVYQYRSSAGSSDGALGSRPETATGTILLGLQLVNDTGISLTEFTLGYTGEQWYKSSTDQLNQYVVSYRFGSITNLDDNSSPWTTIPALEFDSIHHDGGTAESLNGSLAENQTVLSPVTVSGINWESGTELWIRWYDANSSGIDQALAIDDVSFAAVPEPGSIAFLFGCIGTLAAISRRKRS